MLTAGRLNGLNDVLNSSDISGVLYTFINHCLQTGDGRCFLPVWNYKLFSRLDSRPQIPIDLTPI